MAVQSTMHFTRALNRLRHLYLGPSIGDSGGRQILLSFKDSVKSGVTLNHCKEVVETLGVFARELSC